MFCSIVKAQSIRTGRRDERGSAVVDRKDAEESLRG
jgi:hypothetical protein